MESRQVQKANVNWVNGTPVSARFNDPYFSTLGGLAESRHVFLAGNDLPFRFRSGFHIAELGFGTGLNLIAAWHAWNAAGIDGSLTFTSFEAFPMSPDEMEKSLAAWPELSDFSNRFLTAFRHNKDVILPGLNFRLILGDANKTLPNWQNSADAWFLDGFSPVKNPEMWSRELLFETARHTKPLGSFATYTAAGQVRRDLDAAGFDVQRISGHGKKRHMAVGRKRNHAK